MRRRMPTYADVYADVCNVCGKIHVAAVVGGLVRADVCPRMLTYTLTYADVCGRIYVAAAFGGLVRADVCPRMLTYTLTYAKVCGRIHVAAAFGGLIRARRILLCVNHEG
jgi:hypothetical protein